MTLPNSVTLMASPPPTAALAPDQARLLVAIRLWVLWTHCGYEPHPALSARFGSAAAAREFAILMAFAATAWPEPIRTHPPCCRRTSLDELLLLDMVSAAAGRDRRGFETLLSEMLPAHVRERLYASARRFITARACAT